MRHIFICHCIIICIYLVFLSSSLKDLLEPATLARFFSVTKIYKNTKDPNVHIDVAFFPKKNPVDPYVRGSNHSIQQRTFLSELTWYCVGFLLRKSSEIPIVLVVIAAVAAAVVPSRPTAKVRTLERLYVDTDHNRRNCSTFAFVLIVSNSITMVSNDDQWEPDGKWRRCRWHERLLSNTTTSRYTKKIC